MSKGGSRENAGRPPGVLNRATERMIKTVREIIAEDPERYHDILRMLVEDGRNVETKPRDRLLIASFLADRIEGKVPDKVELTNSAQTVDTLVRLMRETNDRDLSD